MPRPRKPLSQLKLHGGYREDRHGGRCEPTPSGEPVPPIPLKDMPPAVRKQWRLWKRRLKEVATDWDSVSLYSLCRYLVLWHESMTELEQCDPADRELRRQSTLQTNRFWKVVEQLLSRFGLNPVFRTQIQQKSASHVDDEFESLLA